MVQLSVTSTLFPDTFFNTFTVACDASKALSKVSVMTMEDALLVSAT